MLLFFVYLKMSYDVGRPTLFFLKLGLQSFLCVCQIYCQVQMKELENSGFDFQKAIKVLLLAF